MSKSRILVLGGKIQYCIFFYGLEWISNLILWHILGCGFIGRNFVTYLVKNDLASAIRVVDKVPPQVAWLNKIHGEAFNSEIVEYKSANLINAGMLHHSICVSTLLSLKIKLYIDMRILVDTASFSIQIILQGNDNMVFPVFNIWFLNILNGF